MGKPSRDKGLRVERKIVALHAEIGVKAERVPLSGAAKFRNTAGSDVDIYPFGPETVPFVSEVKARASGEGFATLERWLGINDLLFLVRDRQSPLVVMPWETWASLLEVTKR